MKKISYILTAGFAVLLLIAANRPNKNAYGLKKGTPEIKSISALAFGPDGILFIGDSKAASVFAIDTKDKAVMDEATAVEIKNIDQKIAASLGTEAKNIRIQDIAVNPLSKKVYVAVQGMDGTPVLLTVEGEKIQAVSLKDILYSTVSIANAPSEDQKDRGGRSLREQVISDLNFADGSVMLSGLSNQEFSSTFRKIPFPFTDKQDQASLEIYHAAHGRYETNAPIKTFTTAELNGKKYLVASYTCTPLVLFPLDELQPGKHVKGRTVGEFGAGNSPIDMITVKKGDNTYLVMANSSRPLMRVKYKNIEAYQGSLTEPVKESFSTAGVDFVTLPVVNVLQMDKLDDGKVLVLQRKSNGDLDLSTLNDWMFS
jgi:DNA-binding beta-propeller fold protein YncE